MIALLYQLLYFGPAFVGNINLNGKGNWFSIWHICTTWKKSTKVIKIYTLSDCYIMHWDIGTLCILTHW
jgi:hypothetical protein